LIEYFEYVRDPIKFYFQEKAANLFLKKEVVKVFIEEDNKSKNPKKEPIQVLTNSFLNFSELRDGSDPYVQKELSLPNGKNSVFSKKEVTAPQLSETVIMENYNKDQMTKRMDMIMMVKVNDEMIQKETDPTKQISNRLVNFEKNDSLISSNLESQTSAVNNRLAQRKLNSKLRCQLKSVGSQD